MATPRMRKVILPSMVLSQDDNTIFRIQLGPGQFRSTLKQPTSCAHAWIDLGLAR